MSLDELHAVISDIYDAAVDPDVIPAVLRSMCALTNSSAGIFLFRAGETIERDDDLFGIDPAFPPIVRALPEATSGARRYRHSRRAARARRRDQAIGPIS